MLMSFCGSGIVGYTGWYRSEFVFRAFLDWYSIDQSEWKTRAANSNLHGETWARIKRFRLI